MSSDETNKRKRSSSSESQEEQAIKRQKLDEKSEAQSEETMDVSCDESTASKRSRKRIDRRPSSGIFIWIENCYDEEIGKEICDQVDDDSFQRDNPGAKAKIIPLELVRIYPSAEESKKERKIYRQKYNQKPETILKRKEKAKSPEEIEKRKKNNEDEETKERKKICALARRKILADIKENHSDLYEEKRKKHLPPLPPKPKAPRVKKTKAIKLTEEPLTPAVEVQ